MNKYRPTVSKKTAKKMKTLDRLTAKGSKGNKRAAEKAIKLSQELDLEYRGICRSCKLHTIFGIIF